MSTAVPLPAGATLGKSYEYGLDVNLGTYADPTWQPFRRISGFNPTDTPTTQDAQTYDDLGATNSDVTGWSWALAFNAQVNRILSTGLYLPEVEYLNARAGDPTAKGELAVADVRWYHKPENGTPNPNDAFRGLATVARTRNNTGAEGAIEVLGFTLTGKGPKEKIANPFAGWDVTAPTIAGITPPGAVTTDIVTITGTGLLGATAVTFDGIAADDFLVFNGSSLVATLPADTAGTVPVVVTTPGGTSAAFNYVRGA
jgi:hypothetical protein